jgi:glycosyltransferase involved in cell wall biosynthesis
METNIENTAKSIASTTMNNIMSPIELEKRLPSLVICFPTKSDYCALTVASLMNLGSNSELLQRYRVLPRLGIGQSDLPKARSEHMTSWYDEAQPGDVFMFIDSDQTFRPEDILKSASFLDRADIVCGAYPRRAGTMTVEPRNVVEFYRNNCGPLWYGSTGFMMISYNIAHRLVTQAFNNKKVPTSLTSSAYPFFYERIVDESETNRFGLWLGEDYSFCWLARQYGGQIYGYISPSIGHLLLKEEFVKQPSRTIWPSNSVVYFCGETAESWSPKDISTGIGGSELAVIELSRRWKRLGYDVTVFCTCDAPGIYEGVTYRKVTDLNAVDIFNIIIIWRSIELAAHADFEAKVRILDLHDVVSEKHITPLVLKNIDYICVKSNFHADLCRKGLLNPGDIEKLNTKLRIITNGGAYEPELLADPDSEKGSEENVPDKKGSDERNPYSLIYASSYDRGLYYMLKWGWPRIKAAIPQAELKIYYGWNVYDALKRPPEFKATMQALMKQPGIYEGGRISRKRLVQEKSRASIHWYTGDFAEIDCITVRESAWVGTMPIVSEQIPVFGEKPYCITIPGNPQTEEMQNLAAEVIIKLMQDPANMEKIRQKCVVPPEESWDRVAEKWTEIFKQR